MPRTTTTTKRVPSSEARANLAELLELVGSGKQRVLIERRGKPPVALVSVDELLQFELLKESMERHGGGHGRS